MPSRPRSADIQPNTASRCDRSEVDRSRRPCLLGWRIISDGYPSPPTWRVPSDTPYDRLTALLSGGKHPARKIKRAQILLAADAGVGDEAIAASVSVDGSTVYRTKRRFVEGDLELALAEEARSGAGRKLTGHSLFKPACGGIKPGVTRKQGI